MQLGPIALGALVGSLTLAGAAGAQGSLATTGQSVLGVGESHPSLPAGTKIRDNGLDSAAMDLRGNLIFRARMDGGSLGNPDDRAWFYGRANGDLQLLLQAQQQAPGLPAGIFLGSATFSTIGSSCRISDGVLWLSASINGASVTTADDTAYFYGPADALGVLVREGDTAPGTSGGTFSSSFSSLSLQASGMNENGTVMFKSSIAGGDVSGTTNNEAFFTGTPGALQIALRKGDTIPTGETISALGFVSQLNSNDQLLLDATLSQDAGVAVPATAADDKVLLVVTGGVSAVVVREGDAAPGTAGATFNTSTNSWSVNTGSNVFNASGNTVIVADLLNGDVVAGTNDRAIYYGGTSGLSMVVRRGDVAPGTGGLTFDVFNNSSVTCNDAGVIGFVANLAGPGVTTDNDGSLWVGTPGNLQMLAREGDQAPGFAVGDVFAASGVVGGTSSPNLNQRGQVLFGANVLVGGATNTSTQWGWDPTLGLQLLLAAGDSITTQASATYSPFAASSGAGLANNSGDSSPLSFNNHGDFVFRVGGSAGTQTSGAIVRGHLGSNDCGPSSIDALAGGTHTMQLNAGLAHAGLPYVVVASGSGTRPGFNFGVHVELNPDFWFTSSIVNLNLAPWSGTFGTLDAAGKATASLTTPPGFAAVAGHDVSHVMAVLTGPPLSAIFASEPCSVLFY